jgi:DNA anti-recombination protein RmuC
MAKVIHIHLNARQAGKTKDSSQQIDQILKISKQLELGYTKEKFAGKSDAQLASLLAELQKRSKAYTSDASESISLSKVLAKFPEAKAFGLFDVTFMNGAVHMGSNYDLPKDLVAKIEAFVKGIVTIK